MKEAAKMAQANILPKLWLVQKGLGMNDTQLAKKAGLNKSVISRAKKMTLNSNIELVTVLQIIGALGLRFYLVQPETPEEMKQPFIFLNFN